jgi:hypothetical protein
MINKIKEKISSLDKNQIIYIFSKLKGNKDSSLSKKDMIERILYPLTQSNQFLYHPDNLDKSFDVYIDKNPQDTISIKYKTYNDVKNTISKLERLYKRNKYTHKRIFQVAMILKVRLGVIYKKYNKKKKEYQLAEKYLKFLNKRTKQDEKDRKKMIFN